MEQKLFMMYQHPSEESQAQSEENKMPLSLLDISQLDLIDLNH